MPVPTSAHWRVALGLVLATVLLLAIAWLTKSDAKGTVAIAAAIAGLSTVAVGLALAQDAFRILYDKDRKSRIRKRSPRNLDQMDLEAEGAAVEQIAADITNAATIAGVTVDLNTLLPKLITSAAGLAIALVLLGTLLLGAATFGSPGTSASPSPGGSAAPAPATPAASLP